MFCFLWDGEANPDVISMASSFEQANLTFGEAKKYIANNPRLQKHCDPQQFKIRLKKRHGTWGVISGKPTGRSGTRTSCCIADEAHEWLAPTVQAYNLVSANMFKREQPLLLVATNAPSTSTSFCNHLYTRAKDVLDGKSDNETLLPVIYEAPRSLKWDSEEAARAANPSIPHIITFDRLASRIAKAKETSEDEAEYRRLYLSQQAQSATKGIDIVQWDSCTTAFDPSSLKDAVCYVGIDTTVHDDLYAVVYIYATASRYYVDARFWMPATTAERYHRTHALPYLQWADEGHITLCEETTISDAVSARIAANVIATSKATKVKAVCFDRSRSEYIVAALEAAGLTLVPIGQGWGVSLGTDALGRRLKEKSIQIMPNKVLRACAEIVEYKQDERGNYWPIKPNAKGSYAGKRSAKIDGISSLVTAMTEARKHVFPVAKAYVGSTTFNLDD